MHRIPTFTLALIVALSLAACQSTDEAAPAAQPRSSTSPDPHSDDQDQRTPADPQSDAAAEQGIPRPRLDSFHMPTGDPAPSWPVAVADAPAPPAAGGWPRGGVIHPEDVDRADGAAVAAAYLQLLMSSDANTDTGRADAWRRAAGLATPQQAQSLTADLPGGSSNDAQWVTLQQTGGYSHATVTIDFTQIIPGESDDQLLARAHVIVTEHDDDVIATRPELAFDVVLALQDGQQWAVESTHSAVEVNHDDHSH